MIVFDLECQAAGHRFEGWFASSEDYEGQRTRGLLTCPVCGDGAINKAVMAPNLGRKGNQLPDLASRAKGPSAASSAAPSAPQAVSPPVPAQPLPAEAAALFQAIATAQADALKNSQWVGERFTDQARAMHYGEREPALIHGQATPDQARELLEEGVAVAPLLIPVVPPEQNN